MEEFGLCLCEVLPENQVIDGAHYLDQFHHRGRVEELTTPPAEARGVLGGASTLPPSLCWRGKAALVWLRSDFGADALRHGEYPCFGA
jgi:hypothetical protein